MIKIQDRVEIVPNKATEYLDYLHDLIFSSAQDAGIKAEFDLYLVAVEKDYVHFNIEAWSTFELTLRLEDMKLVLEGKDLTRKEMGWDTVDFVLNKIVPDLKIHHDYIKLYNSTDFSKFIIINYDTLVEFEGEVSAFSRTEHVFLVEFEPGSTPPGSMMGPFIEDTRQKWYGFDHENAVMNALKYQPNRKPIKVTYLSSERTSNNVLS